MKSPQRGLIVSCLLGLSLVALVLLLVGAARASDEGFEVTSAAAQSDASQAALDYIRDNRARWGLTAADVEGLVLVNQHTSQHNGLTHLYFWQTHAGLDVVGAVFNISLKPDGTVLHHGNRLIPDLAAQVNEAAPSLAAEQAVRAAADNLKLSLSEPLQVRESFDGPAQGVLFSDGGVSLHAIPARLVYQPVEKGGVRLAWNVEIYERDASHYWNMSIDAVDGSLLAQVDYVDHDNWGTSQGSTGSAAPSLADLASATTSDIAAQSGPNAPESPDDYRVYALPYEYPDDGARTLVSNPANLTASPFGWHDTNGAAGAEYTITRGNNVHADTDTNFDNVPDGNAPDGGAGLSFDFPIDLSMEPNTYVDASVTNLFYWNNIVHDVYYLYGFDEPSGNFQVNNYGNGGLGGDYVQADAHDGVGLNNANFATPPDGVAPRMQMFLWNQTVPGRDGSLSSMIIAHEYGHGISNRLTGGPATTACLSNDEQMGEGWSDFFGLVLTADAADTSTTARGVGTYVLGEPTTGAGIRPTRYSTDLLVNPTTYDDISGLAIPHGVGYAWASMLWEVYWTLVDQYGFNADIYGAWSTGGNNLALQLVMDGLKLQPCSPGFVDGRDAILAADVALTGGANQCSLWEAFAKRGLGYSASQGSSNSTADGTEAFDVPATCGFMTAQPATQNVCAGNDALFEVRAGSGYSPPVTLSSAGAPAGTTTTFATNPLVTVPSTTTMTIGNTAGASAGSYNITITGTDATTSESTLVSLNVSDAPPGSTSLIAPADGAINVPIYPAFAWSSAAGAQSYLLEVDDDPGFGSIDYTTTVTGTSHVATTPLSNATTYHWRVSPQNGCGSTPSAVFSFTVHPPLVCNNSFSANFEAGIPGDWTVVDDSAGGAGIDWTTTADAVNCGIGNLTGGSGEAACADSDAAGIGAPAYDTSLLTPLFALDDAYSASLNLNAYYRDLSTNSNDFFDVDIWDGGSWSSLLHWDETHTATPLFLDLESYLGQSGLQVRFRYAGDGWDWYAEVDDVSLVKCNFYGALLSPDAQQIDLPGEDVVHTVHITNTGSTADTFDLSLSGDTWTTVLSDASVALPAGASTSFDVTVSIPGGASGGDADSVTVTATSQGDPTQTAMTELQTIVASYSVELSPDAQAEGLPDSDVVYTVQITNTGNVSDTFDLTVSGNSWATTLSSNMVALVAGASTSVDVTVSIPANAADGDMDSVTVTATSQADPGATATVNLQTTAVWYKLYLPAIFKP